VNLERGHKKEQSWHLSFHLLYIHEDVDERSVLKTEQEDGASEPPNPVNSFPYPYMNSLDRNTWDDLSLGRMVESFVKPNSQSIPSYFRGLRNLLCLLRYDGKESQQRSNIFLQIIKKSQISVLALLEEWWAGVLGGTIMPKIKKLIYQLAFSDIGNVDGVDYGPAMLEVLPYRLLILEELVPADDAPYLRKVRKDMEDALLSNHFPDNVLRVYDNVRDQFDDL
jgi:hypothetical protein